MRDLVWEHQNQIIMSKTGNTYTEEFRRDAVELLESSGRPISEVARDLGVNVNVNSLRSWRNRILGQSGGMGTGAVGDGAQAGASAEDMLAEIKRLKKENEYLRRQREILKKAASILSENPELGMR